MGVPPAGIRPQTGPLPPAALPVAPKDSPKETPQEAPKVDPAKVESPQAGTDLVAQTAALLTQAEVAELTATINTRDQVQANGNLRENPMDPNTVSLGPPGQAAMSTPGTTPAATPAATPAPATVQEAVPAAQKWLRQLSGGQYDKMSPEQKQQLGTFLATLDPNALMAATVQGASGRTALSMLTGSGAGGHYVNSAMNSLAQMLKTGRLNNEVLGALNEMGKAPLHADLQAQRMELISSTLQNIAFPEKINQHARGTCAAGTAEIQMSVDAPDRYIKLVTGLASPDGKVGSPPLQDGAEMQREADTLKDDKSGRSLASRLVQPAFMEYADGDLDYNNQDDVHLKDGKGDHDGLYGDESVHLAKALFGAAHVETIGGDNQEEKLARMEEELKAGRTISIGMKLGYGGHRVLLTGIDRDTNKAFFMNPWGELHTLPLDEFQANLREGVVNTGKPASSKSAMAALPGAASDPANYDPIFSVPNSANPIANTLEQDPALRSLSSGQKQAIVERFDDLKIPAAELDRVLRVAQAGPIPQAMLDRLASAQTKDDAIKTLRLYEHVAVMKPDPALAQRLLASYPEKNLTTRGFESLMDALVQNDASKLGEWADTAEQAIAGKSGGLTSSEIRSRFDELRKGSMSEVSYERLEQLGSLADVDTKAYMIQQLMKGSTSSRAERSISLLIGNATVAQQKELLSKVDLKTLGSELENADQAAEVLNLMSHAGFDPKAMESSIGQFIDGVASNNHGTFGKAVLTALSVAGLGSPPVDQDIKVVTAFLRKLDDKTLAALPENNKARFLNTLADKHLSERDLQALLPRLVQNCTPATLQNTVSRLMDGYTNGREENVIYNILLHSKPQDLATLSRNLDFMRRVADELDARPLANLMNKMAVNGQWQAAENMLTFRYRDNNGTSDNLANDFTTNLSPALINQAPKSFLHSLHKAMDEGWTTDHESAMMQRVKQAKNW